MNPPALTNHDIRIQQAYQALQRKDFKEARRIAEEVSRLAPGLEEPWLILAALSSSEDSLNYLKHALEINPTSARARNGIHWAIHRQRIARQAVMEARVAASMEKTQPIILPQPPTLLGESTALKHSIPLEKTTPARSKSRLKLLPLGIGVLLVCSLVFFWVGYPDAAAAYTSFFTTPIPLAQLFQPAFTNTPTPTQTQIPFTPTTTATTVPTSTVTVTVTATSTPTATHTITRTVTSTVTRTATAVPTFTRTPIPTKTNTPKPKSTSTPVIKPTQTTVRSTPLSGVGESERWVDVDVRRQRAYAYEGKTLVKSFIISTGTWQHPTVLGQYHIYVKYRYANMSGPGYFLPNVPYVMYFYQGYGLHGTYWHSNFGTPMSHGCINFTIADAGWLFNWTSIGTLVNIHN